jgi:hypothetical protein
MEDIALPIVSLVVPTDEDTDTSDKCDNGTSSDTEKPPLDPRFATNGYDRLLPGDFCSVGGLLPEKKAPTRLTDCTQAEAEAKAEKAASNEQIVKRLAAGLKRERVAAAAAAAAAAFSLPPEKEALVRFRDALGRMFEFPYYLCKKWSVSVFLPIKYSVISNTL